MSGIRLSYKSASRHHMSGRSYAIDNNSPNETNGNTNRLSLSDIDPSSSALAGGTRTLKITTEYGGSSASGLSPFAGTAATQIRDTREREKKDLQDLNDRLANYIEKVRLFICVYLR